MWETQGRKIFTVRVLLTVDLARRIAYVSERELSSQAMFVRWPCVLLSDRNIEVNSCPLGKMTLV